MPADITSKDYIDRSMDAVRAQNDARFADVVSRLDTIQKTSLHPGQFWAGILTTIIAIGALIVGVLAYGGDQFGAGSSLADQRQEQLQRDQAQDEKLDAILNRLDEIVPQTDAPTP